MKRSYHHFRVGCIPVYSFSRMQGQWVTIAVTTPILLIFAEAIPKHLPLPIPCGLPLSFTLSAHLFPAGTSRYLAAREGIRLSCVSASGISAR